MTEPQRAGEPRRKKTFRYFVIALGVCYASGCAVALGYAFTGVSDWNTPSEPSPK